MDFLARPLGIFLYWIYDTVAFQNYGLAIIIFTVLVRIALFPLTLKQYKSSAQMQKFQPILQEVQRKYANDKEKLNQETMKLYQEHKINPAGGCLPLLIQMPILFALWQTITKPLKFMLGFTDTQLTELASKANITGSTYLEIDTITHYVKNGMGDQVGNLNMFFPSESFGINLGTIPTWRPETLFSEPKYLIILIFPLLAAFTTFITSKLSMPKTNDKKSNPMGNSMLYIMPLMTLMFAFQFPTGLSLYWIAGNVVAIVQQYYVNKYILKKKE